MTKYKYGSKELKEILDDVRMCKMLCCTKDGKVYSLKAEEYLLWMNEYAKYCLEDMQDIWKKDVKTIVYGPLILRPEFRDDPDGLALIKNNTSVIIDTLFDFMNTGLIMQVFDETSSWEEVERMLDEQGHSGSTLSSLENMMIKYASIGTDFIEHVDPNRITRDKKFKKIYEKKLINKRIT